MLAFSDWLDGYVAKNYEGQATVLGSYLDPLADKLMINALALSLWHVDILPGPIVGLWLARDIALVSFSYYSVLKATKGGQAVTDPGRTPLKIRATAISRVNTTLQFMTLCAGLATPIGGLPPDFVLGLW